MKVRALDINGDFLFGKGRNNYLKDASAVSQNIKTRLKSFFGDCFFALEEGIDWFNLLGSKRILELRLAVSTTILNTDDVVQMIELNFSVDSNRELLIEYKVLTSYGVASGSIGEGELNG